jgi:hypothetical protein
MTNSDFDPQEDSDDDDMPEVSLPGNSTVRAADKTDRKQIAQFVTTIKNAEQQVGEHIIRALQHDDTVAVITTVAIGPDGQQRVISAALSPERLQQVQELLQAAEEEREDEEPCVGFHCLVKPRGTV